MTQIRHNVVIKATPEKIYEAVTTQEGLASWWAKQTTAKAEMGFVNTFTFGEFRNEIKVTKLIPDNEVKWECIDSIEEWIGTTISFNLEEKEQKTLLRFTHGDWKEVSDIFAGCNYNWALFMKSLKLYCETGTGSPS